VNIGQEIFFCCKTKPSSLNLFPIPILTIKQSSVCVGEFQFSFNFNSLFPSIDRILKRLYIKKFKTISEEVRTSHYTQNMHLRMFMVNVQTCTHVIQKTVRCQETNLFTQLTMYEKAVLLKSVSLKASNIGSIGAPNGFSVSATLSRFSTAYVSRPVAECQISFLGHTWNILMLNVEGHSHRACTSSSWWTQLQWWHSLFSRTTGRVHNRVMKDIFVYRTLGCTLYTR